ncbi:MAG: ABC transporter ATP-binding protein [Pseudomonadota bacterium]
MTLELKAVTKKVGGEPHIYETSLTFEVGGFNILLGATNAGKSTLIKLMAGLERPSSGEIWAEGRNVTGLNPQKRRIALVHQFFVNYPHMSVFDNIASPLRVQGMPEDEVKTRVQEAADILKLGPMLARRPQELSGGQQQRTALARAIVKDATAIFLDEPLANLDYKLREELRDQLPELLGDRGTVVVYATSEPTEALLLGGHTALLHEGRVSQFGPTTAIYRAPADLTSARVFSDPPINLAEVEKKGDRMHLGALHWQVAAEAAALRDGPYTMGIRPHHITPTEPEGDTVRITGDVQITELSGSESVAHFAVGPTSWVSLAAGIHPYRVGEAHDFFMVPGHCYYFAPDGALAARGRLHHG